MLQAWGLVMFPGGLILPQSAVKHLHPIPRAGQSGLRAFLAPGSQHPGSLPTHSSMHAAHRAAFSLDCGPRCTQIPSPLNSFVHCQEPLASSAEHGAPDLHSSKSLEA